MYESFVGQVAHSQATSIHGVVFYDVVLKTGQEYRRLRIQDTFLPSAPALESWLEVELILGNVSQVRPANAPEGQNPPSAPPGV